MTAKSRRLPDANRYSLGEKLKREAAKNYQLYLIILIPVVYMIIFYYVPMYGAQIAFRNYRAVDGIVGSKWVGFKHFIDFFRSYRFNRVIRNTLILSIYTLLASFPVPIILALALNAVRNMALKKTVQMVTYAPHFISMVVMMGIVVQFLSLKYGIVNKIIVTLGGEGIMFMGEAKYFSSIFVWSGVWQRMGWSSIIYLSALSAIDIEQHEAAIVDGASRFQRVLHVDIPGILPTMVILFILSTGRMLNIGVEKALLLQNDMNIETSEIISTYVYKVVWDANMPNYSYGTAIGLFNSFINFVLIITVNKISKKISETSLW